MTCVSNNEPDIVLSSESYAFCDIGRGCDIDGIVYIVP